jgi:hypothetical protein
VNVTELMATQRGAVSARRALRNPLPSMFATKIRQKRSSLNTFAAAQILSP